MFDDKCASGTSLPDVPRTSPKSKKKARGCRHADAGRQAKLHQEGVDEAQRKDGYRLLQTSLDKVSREVLTKA
jgi:hypothetical protein